MKKVGFLGRALGRGETADVPEAEKDYKRRYGEGKTLFKEALERVGVKASRDTAENDRQIDAIINAGEILAEIPDVEQKRSMAQQLAEAYKEDSSPEASLRRRGALFEAQGFDDASKQTLTLYPDRIVWVKHHKGGALLIKADRGSETMPIRNVASCVVEKDGLVCSKLKIHGSGNHIEFRAAHRTVSSAQGAILEAMSAASPAPSPVSPPAPATDDATELRKLAQLHSEGILTDEEFAAKKRQILGLD